MKNKIKILTIGATALSATLPITSMLSSCNKGPKSSETIATELRETTIEQFKWICQFYRNTFENKWFCDMLVRHIKQLGFKVVENHDYKPVEETATEYGYNFYFDIPSNDITLESVILQAHTDMVCSNVDGYNWAKGVVPVIVDSNQPAGKIMHTDMYQSSLGADDGIGIATMLAIAIHNNEFKHGKIRCLFTVDEEDGDSGAQAVPTDWLSGFSYYLNLDGEDTHISWTSSGGCQQAYFELEDSLVAPIDNEKYYRVDIDKYSDDERHSALVMKKNLMNSVELMAKLIQGLAADGTNVRLVGSCEKDDKAAKTTGGTVPNEIHFIIATDKASGVEENIKNTITTLASKEQYSGENWETIAKQTKVTEVTTGISNTDGISKKNTDNICNLITDEDKPLYGVWSWFDETKKDFPKTACNISAVRLGDGVAKSETNKLYFEVFGRSCSLKELGPNPKIITEPTEGFMFEFSKKLKTFGITPTTKWTSMGYNLPWEEKENNQMSKLLSAGAASIKHELSIEPVLGWLEIGEITAKNPNMHCGSIGPTIKKVHTINETLYVDTLIPMYQIMLYVLENAKPITNKQ